MKTGSSVNPSSAKYVLDTSALIAYLAEEPGAARLTSLRHDLALPFVVLTELYYVMWRQQDQLVADETLQHVLSWHLPLLIADERLSVSAGYLKARYRLGLADSYVAAFALAHRAVLVTNDPDFRPLQPDLKLLSLR